jgi:SAM-dependent methyltransferase
MPTVDQVRTFWEANPVAAAAIPYPLGSPEYFREFDRLRFELESQTFLNSLFEFDRFRGRKVLDVGCGNGFVLSHFARAGAIVTGIDLTEVAVRLSRQRFEQAGLQGEFLTGNAEDLPFQDSTFACVTSMGVLHHTPNTEKAIGDLRRVLKPGGRIVLMFYHRDSLLYRFKLQVMARRSRRPVEDLVNDVDGSGNPRGDVYTKEELRRMLTGFEDLELFAGALEPRHVLPVRVVVGPGRVREWARAIVRPALIPFTRRFGWFLYARGRKAA